MNKFNNKSNYRLLYLLSRNCRKSRQLFSSSSLARLYSISFSIVKGSPLAAFNQENEELSSSTQGATQDVFSLKRRSNDQVELNSKSSSESPSEIKQTINLTKYGSSASSNNNKFKGVNLSSSRQTQQQQQTNEQLLSSNILLAQSARLLSKNGRSEDAITLIKQSCIKDEKGDLDIKNIILQEAGIEVIYRLFQAYSTLGKLEEMNKIMPLIPTNIEQHIKLQGEIIKLHASTASYAKSLKLLDDLTYTPAWNLFFLGTLKVLLASRPESVHEIFTFLNQYIERRRHEINQTITDSSKHLKELPMMKTTTTATSTTAGGSIDNSSSAVRRTMSEAMFIRFRKFFDATGPQLDRVRFSLITIESLVRLEDFETVELLFNLLIDKNESNNNGGGGGAILQKLKGLMMHTLIAMGRYEDALSVYFDIKTPPSLKTYEKLLHAYIDIGQFDFAIYLCETYIPNPSIEIYVLLVKAHIMKGNIQKAEEIIRDLFNKSQISESSQRVITTLLMSAYAEAGLIVQVQKLFHSIKQPDTRCYNELMKAYCHVGDCKRVKQIFQSIPSQDSVSFLYLLDSLAIEGCSSTTALRVYWVIPSPNHFHADAVVRALLSDTQHGGIDKAREFFNQLRNPSIVTRKRMLRGISNSGDLDEAFNFFKTTIPNPDAECFGILLKTFFYAADISTEIDIDRAEEFFQRIPYPDASCYASMMSIYGRLGQLEMVDNLLHEYPSPATVLAFFYSYFSNGSDRVDGFWEKCESLVEQYPRCFTKAVYLEAIKEAVKYRRQKASLYLFTTYYMREQQQEQNKQTRDLLGLLLFIEKESYYEANIDLVKEIIGAVPKCIGTPNTLEQIKEIVSKIHE